MENKAEERYRVQNIIKENASSFIAIGGFIFVIYQMVILPIKQLEYSVGDILNNHLKTIQDEQVRETAERKAQTSQLNSLATEITKLSTILDEERKTK